jgi:hypothetical protein
MVRARAVMSDVKSPAPNNSSGASFALESSLEMRLLIPKSLSEEKIVTNARAVTMGPQCCGPK